MAGVEETLLGQVKQLGVVALSNEVLGQHQNVLAHNLNVLLVRVLHVNHHVVQPSGDLFEQNHLFLGQFGVAVNGNCGYQTEHTFILKDREILY